MVTTRSGCWSRIVLVGARDLPGHANISQTSTYLQSSAKSLGLAIEKKEAHERQLEEARTKQKEEEGKEEA